MQNCLSADEGATSFRFIDVCADLYVAGPFVQVSALRSSWWVQKSWQSWFGSGGRTERKLALNHDDSQTGKPFRARLFVSVYWPGMQPMVVARQVLDHIESQGWNLQHVKESQVRPRPCLPNAQRRLPHTHTHHMHGGARAHTSRTHTRTRSRTQSLDICSMVTASVNTVSGGVFWRGSLRGVLCLS